MDDSVFIFKLLNSPKWIKNIGDRGVKSVKQAEEYIKERMLPQLERLGYGNFTVIRKSDDIKIGTCGLYDREGLEGLDIGFAFLPEYEGQGYAYEAAKKLMQTAITEFKISKIKGITLESNIASRRLLEKLGLVYKEMIRIADDSEELMLYEYNVE